MTAIADRPGTETEATIPDDEQEAKTDEYEAKTLARAPQLTPDQRQRLTAIMKAGAK
jgi:hypothetical protein